jgi:hypothetical protein
VIISVRFGFYKKKIIKPNFFFKKTETEPKLVQTDRFLFGSVLFFQDKTGSNWFDSIFSGLDRFFRHCSVFFQFGSVFFGWGSIQFFQFQAYKTETEPNWSVFLKF